LFCKITRNIFELYFILKRFNLEPISFTPYNRRIRLLHHEFFDTVYKANREDQLTLELLRLELEKLDVMEKIFCKIYNVDSFELFISHSSFGFLYSLDI
jgi:hypothetical protein